MKGGTHQLSNVVLVICDNPNCSFSSATYFNRMLAVLGENHANVLLHNENAKIISDSGKEFIHNGRWETVSKDDNIYMFMNKRNFYPCAPDENSGLRIKVISSKELIKFVDELVDVFMEPVLV